MALEEAVKPGAQGCIVIIDPTAFRQDEVPCKNKSIFLKDFDLIRSSINFGIFADPELFDFPGT